MGKRKLFLDFDSTITDSISSFCKCYNFVYKDHPDFKPAIPELVQQWDLKDQCSLIPNPEFIFADPYFFEHLEFMDENTYDVLKELNKKYEIIIVSIGTPMNLSYKSIYLKDNLPFIKNYVLINNGNCEMNKEIVRMNYGGAVFVDDVLSNLVKSDCPTKYIYGKEYEWNKGGKYPRLKNWSEVYGALI
jgi:5'(3')-deoxyribonucleotidase